MTPTQPTPGLGPYKPSNYNTDSGTAYPLTIDADLAIIGRESDIFTPCAMDTPLMRVVVGPGFIFMGTAVTLGGTGTVMQGNRDFSGNIVSGSSVITAISRVDGLRAGMLIQGSSIPLNTTIVSVDISTQGAGQITISAPATATVASNPLRASQLTAVVTAPTLNPRNDIVYVDGSSGIVGIATGSQAANPSDPTLPNGKLPIARIRLTGSSVTAITNSMMDDIRVVSQAPFIDPTTTRGDIIYRGAAALQRRAIGAANQILISDGTDPQYAELTSIFDAKIGSTPGLIPVRGGSLWGGSSVASLLDAISSLRGAILVRGPSGWVSVAPGAASTVLTMGANDPAWAAAATVNDYVWLQYTLALGSNGTFVATGSWQLHPINTKAYDAGGICSLSSNQFTMATGTYHLTGLINMGSADPGHDVTSGRLRNITDGTTVAISVNWETSCADDGTFPIGETTFAAHFDAVIQLTAGKTYRFEGICIDYTGTTKMPAHQRSSGEAEIYANLVFRRFA